MAGEPAGVGLTTSTTGPTDGSCMGVLETARPVHPGVPHRVAARMATHLLDVSASFEGSLQTGRFVDVASEASMEKRSEHWPATQGGLGAVS